MFPSEKVGTNFSYNGGSSVGVVSSRTEIPEYLFIYYLRAMIDERGAMVE
jgi:hypothetical protein